MQSKLGIFLGDMPFSGLAHFYVTFFFGMNPREFLFDTFFTIWHDNWGHVNF